MATSKQLLIDQINQDNEPFRLITEKNVDFGLPVSIPEEEAYNTSVLVTGKPLFGYWGDVEVFYTRLDLVDQIHGTDVNSVDPLTPQQLLDALNSRYGTSLALDDLEPFTVPIPAENESAPVNLVALDTSLGWVGEATVNFINQRAYLDVVVSKKALTVLHYVSAETVPTRQSALMALWNTDFTCVRDALARTSPSGYPADFSKIQALCESRGINGWPNGQIYHYDTSQVPTANQDFDRVAMMTTAFSSGIAGPIYLHYNNFDEA